METLRLKKLAAITSIFFACAASNAQADLGANFSVDGSAGGLGGNLITNVDSINFRYSAIINQTQVGGTFLDGDDTFNESGFMSFSAFQSDAGIAISGSGLNNNYQIYSVFEATGTAGVDGSGILADFSSFNLKFYIDDDGDTTFNIPANGTGFTTTGNNVDDIALATANWVPGSDVGEARVFGGLANGDFQVDMTAFGLELFGASFFSDPDPFYSSFFFTGVTTTITGASTTAPFIANATGSGDLAFEVPEPTSLALLGIGLLGLGISSTKRRARKQA